ncbi:MAG TPA: DinB family protein [Candidatus Limnocylindrales bacterium]|nr:DinB family protein [Candidatus Limnocylindrales bacterium]
MNYSLDLAIPILERTPVVLRALLGGLPDEWVRAVDGPGTWSAFDVVGHLIHGEKTDWIPRVRHILEKGESEPFTPFDREAMFSASRGKTMEALLEEFASLRAANVATLRALALSPADLARRGRHPELGAVTLGQHLATWTAHDLGHLRQIAQTLGRQYRDAVGPWRAYLSMM